MNIGKAMKKYSSSNAKNAMCLIRSPLLLILLDDLLIKVRLMDLSVVL
jgi:hypothetical protein